MQSLKGNKIPVKVGSLLLISLFLLVSCKSKTFKTGEDMMVYLQEVSNGYKQEKIVNGVHYTLLYRPTDLLVEQELEGSVTKERLQQTRDKYKKYMYFNLSMSKNNQELLSTAPKNRNEFGAMVNELVFGMRDKVHVYTKSKDTLDMVDFVYPRMYGMSRATTIMFVYPRDKKVLQEEFLNFTIEDLGLYTGEVKFKIKNNKINNEPQLLF